MLCFRRGTEKRFRFNQDLCEYEINLIRWIYEIARHRLPEARRAVRQNGRAGTSSGSREDFGQQGIIMLNESIIKPVGIQLSALHGQLRIFPGKGHRSLRPLYPDWTQSKDLPGTRSTSRRCYRTRSVVIRPPKSISRRTLRQGSRAQKASRTRSPARGLHGSDNTFSRRTAATATLSLLLGPRRR